MRKRIGLGIYKPLRRETGFGIDSESDTSRFVLIHEGNASGVARMG